MVLVDGIDAIYATRHETTHYGGDPCRFVALGPNQRVRLIAQMLGDLPEAIDPLGEPLSSPTSSFDPWNSSISIFWPLSKSSHGCIARQRKRSNLWGLLEKWQVQQSLPLLRLSLGDTRGQAAEPVSKGDIHLPDRVE
ncbi:MAG: hypothetical protein WAK48_14895 [Candidatus Acidiferrum sp.]|jgi:hypothetical protein